MKICVVTTTRAEYGLLRNVISEIVNNKNMELCLLVSGTHLSEDFGYTVNEIIHDGFHITEEIDILSGRDDAAGISETMGTASVKFGLAFSKYKPDMLVVLGDRYELLPICSAALVFNIPIAHISGGEVTEGAIDDCIRHCLTKLSTLHFPGCETYRKRIIQLGEQPDSVFNYGDVGVENVLKMDFMTVKELEKVLDIHLREYICMTYHPVTTQQSDIKYQMRQILDALASFPDLQFIITKANADNGGRYINGEMSAFVQSHKNCFLYASLGIRKYLSLLKYAKAVIGNSSSGIVEAPALHTPTVNIGDRQKGRLMADSILSCEPEKEAIVSAIRRVLSDEWAQRTRSALSLYGSGNTSVKIVREIEIYLTGHSRFSPKKFYDIEHRM